MSCRIVIFELMKYITKYKYFYIGLSKSEDCSSRKFKIFSHFAYKDDHEGIMICADLFNYVFDLELCDSRHWDDKNNKFFDPEKLDSIGKPIKNESVKNILEKYEMELDHLEINREEFDMLTGRPFEEDIFRE